MLAGLDPEGLAFSLDDGHIWNFIEGSPTGIRALAVNPANRAYIYAATEHGIWRSINGGNNWLESNIDLPAGRGHLGQRDGGRPLHLLWTARSTAPRKACRSGSRSRPRRPPA